MARLKTDTMITTSHQFRIHNPLTQTINLERLDFEALTGRHEERRGAKLQSMR